MSPDVEAQIRHRCLAFDSPKSRAALSRCDSVTIDAVIDRSSLLVEIDRIRSAVGAILEAEGCSCPCEHAYDDHYPDCERCVGCLIEGVLR